MNKRYETQRKGTHLKRKETLQNFFTYFLVSRNKLKSNFLYFYIIETQQKKACFGQFRTSQKKIIIQILPSETFQYESILLVRVCKIILATFFIFANIFATMNCRHQHIVSSKSRVGNSLFGFSSKSLDFLSERANHKRITHVALF